MYLHACRLLRYTHQKKEGERMDVNKQIVRATWIGIIANIFLTILKGVFGFLANSKALLADALHSASDIVGSIVILFGVKVAVKPPDEEHPYGHGKAETIASIIVAFLLILVGVEISISAVKSIISGEVVIPKPTALVIIVISIVIKEALFQYKYRLGKRVNSIALISEAWHHRSDAFSSIAALIGIAASIIGNRFDIGFLVYSDAIASIAVAFIVIKMGYSLAKESSLMMMEQVLDPSHVAQFEATIYHNPNVRKVDKIYARTHGRYVVLDVRISVDADLTVEQGHTITKEVKQALILEHEDVHDAIIHLNPYR